MNMKETPHFSFQSELPIEDIGGGLTRQFIGHNEDLMAVRIFFAKGAIGYNHAHRHSQVSLVIEGEFHFNIDGVTKVLKAGDSCYIPPNVDHGATCPTGGILIDTFSPHREDFIKDDE